MHRSKTKTKSFDWKPDASVGRRCATYTGTDSCGLGQVRTGLLVRTGSTGCLRGRDSPVFGVRDIAMNEETCRAMEAISFIAAHLRQEDDYAAVSLLIYIQYYQILIKH